MTPRERHAEEEYANEKEDAKDDLVGLSTRGLKLLDHLMHLDHLKTNDLETGAEVLYRTMKGNFYQTLGLIENMDIKTLRSDNR